MKQLEIGLELLNAGEIVERSTLLVWFIRAQVTNFGLQYLHYFLNTR